MSAVVDHVVDGADLEALHRRLQRADRIDLGDDDAAALAAQRLRAALADLAEAEHDGDLAAEHDVGRAREAVGQRVPAAVDVVELALGHRVVDVDRGEEQRAGFHHLIEPVHTGGGFLADAADRLGEPRPPRLVLRHRGPDQIEDDAPFLRVRVGIERGHLAGLLELDALVHDQRRVAAVVDYQRRSGAVRPLERLVRAPPVLFQSLALPGEDRGPFRILYGAARFGTADHHRRRGVILGREDVARNPAHVGAELGERLDQHGGLNRHVQAAHDACAGQRLGGAVLLPQRHQPGHLLFGEAHFLAADNRRATDPSPCTAHGRRPSPPQTDEAFQLQSSSFCLLGASRLRTLGFRPGLEPKA